MTKGLPERIYVGRCPNGEAIWYQSKDLGNLVYGVEYIRADLADGLAEAVRKVILDGVQETSGNYKSWKNNKCKHGRHGFEGCENCIEEFLSQALDEYEALQQKESA